MTDDSQELIKRLQSKVPCEDRDGCWHCMQEAAKTIKSQQARIELLEKVLEAACATGLGSSEWANRLDVAIADCDNKPAPVPTKKPGKTHPWRKTQARH